MRAKVTSSSVHTAFSSTFAVSRTLAFSRTFRCKRNALGVFATFAALATSFAGLALTSPAARLEWISSQLSCNQGRLLPRGLRGTDGCSGKQKKDVGILHLVLFLLETGSEDHVLPTSPLAELKIVRRSVEGETEGGDERLLTMKEKSTKF